MKFEVDIGEGIRDEEIIKELIKEILRRTILPLTGYCKVFFPLIHKKPKRKEKVAK